MGASYTAKVADADTPPDVPDDWDPDWVFPGPPFPPGYDPEYGINLVTQDMMAPGLPVTDVVLTLTDHGTYSTATPAGLSSWTAVWKDTGIAVPFREVGGGDYGSGFDSAFNYEPELEFDISEGDRLRTVILSSSGNPFESLLTGSSEIRVAADTEEYCTDDDCYPAQQGCRADCSNAQAAPDTTYKGIWEMSECNRYDSGEDGISSAEKDAIHALGDQAEAAVAVWDFNYRDYCLILDYIQELNCDKTELECLGDSTIAIDALIQAAGTLATNTLGAASTARALADSRANACIAAVEATADHARVQAWYHDYVGYHPIADTACADQGPTNFMPEPDRCAVTFSVQGRTTSFSRCTEVTNVGSWFTGISGGYTPTGLPYITGGAIFGVPRDRCRDNTCEDAPYFCAALGGWIYTWTCGPSLFDHEVQTIVTYPSPTEEGETCL